MNNKKTQKHANLFVMLYFLTLLFVAAQLSLFLIHYSVSDLIDSVVKSSIAREFFHPIILFPILKFIGIQCGVYFFFASAIGFISISVGELFGLSSKKIYLLGIFFWLLACMALLSLNTYYFPASFFAKLITQYPFLSVMNQTILCLLSFILSIATLLAYVNFFWKFHHRVLGSLFLFFGFCLAAIAIYDAGDSFPRVKPSENPDIILIGLDSLRPDFTSYLNQRTLHTPHIDHFLQTASTFTQAYTPLARTFPAWISILTAKYPIHNHARANLVDPSHIVIEDSLVKRLKAKGYETMYATDEPRFSDINEEYGFDQIIGPKGGTAEFILGGLGDFPLTNLLLKFSIGRLLFPYNYGNRGADITYEPDKFLQLIKQSLRTRTTQKPLFLSIHLCLSHWPFTWADDHGNDQLPLSERYQNSVVFLDTLLDKLLRLLGKAGMLQHSLVVLLSDHGVTVGLPGDRLLNKENYHGDPHLLKLISAYPLDKAPAFSSIGTSYGQGNDVLSLKQYQVLLAFKGFGMPIPSERIDAWVSLLDIAPTILDILHDTKLSHADGQSLKPYLFDESKIIPRHDPFYIETADTIDELETGAIDIGKVVKKSIEAYQIDLKNGRLILHKDALISLIKHKQRAVLLGEWLLAKYPAHLRLRLEKPSKTSKQCFIKPHLDPPYFVLMNRRTKEWAIDLSSDFAKSAPLQNLKQQLAAFYQDEIPSLVE